MLALLFIWWTNLLYVWSSCIFASKSFLSLSKWFCLWISLWLREGLHISEAGHILNSSEVGISNAFAAAATTDANLDRGRISTTPGKARKTLDQEELWQTISANSKKTSVMVL